MEIHWHGRGCFELRAPAALVVTDPFAAAAGTRLAALQPDVVTLSHPDIDAGALAGEPYVIRGPGEYEVHGIFVVGVESAGGEQAAAPGASNTIYCMDVDGVTVCHLGHLRHALSQSQVEALGNVDVLLLPVGGGQALGPMAAVDTVNQIEPAIVIPLQDTGDAVSGPMEQFLREMGAADHAARPSLRVDAQRLPEEPQVVLLRPVS